MTISLHRFQEEIKSRKLRRALAIYVGFALPVVGIANMLESRYGIEHGSRPGRASGRECAKIPKGLTHDV